MLGRAENEIMRRGILAVAALVALAAGSGGWRQDDAALRDSLSRIEPWARTRWLTRRGLQDYYRANSWEPRPDSGLACVGRWSYGPSVKVSLRTTADDTIVCLARGSGASIIRFRSRDSLTLDLLSDIDCHGVVSRAIIQDTLVFCGMSQGGTGIEVWGVSDLTEPHRMSYVCLPPIMDIAVQDTFLYATGYVQDSLRVFNVADPRNPVQVGACADSGIRMCVAGVHCYLADQYGVNIVDVSDPSTPHRVGSIGGFEALSVAVRDTLLFVGTVRDYVFTFRIYNVRNPAAPVPVGTLADVEASDIYLPPTCDTVLYTPKLHVINIADPGHPRQVGFADCPGWDYGVTAVPALNYVLVADHWQGLVAVDIRQPTEPVVETIAFTADAAEDIVVRDSRAYVASYHAGVRILDVSDPAWPLTLGGYDSVGYTLPTHAVAASDSFAFTGWIWPHRFISIDVSDPGRPTRAGGCTITNSPEDMVLRDSLVYVAMWGGLQVVNVARPREPEMIGSIGTTRYTWGIDVEGDLAAVAHSFSLWLVDIEHPDSLYVAGMWEGDAKGVDIVDTIAYVTAPYTGCVALSIADPSAPYVLDSLHLTDTLWWNDIAVVGSLAYVGGERIWVVDVSDPRHLRLVRGASWTPPYLIRRLHYSAPYLYAASAEAGVCVLESTAVGVVEGPELIRHGSARASIRPNPASRYAVVPATSGLESIALRDVAGRRVRYDKPAGGPLTLDLAALPPGLYFCELRYSRGREVVKLIKR